jgi:hypothetical protein
MLTRNLAEKGETVIPYVVGRKGVSLLPIPQSGDGC